MAGRREREDGMRGQNGAAGTGPAGEERRDIREGNPR